ncbi:MAG: ATP-binding cassette domain-containing protein [Coriobacteriales bacterium]|jgi:energy-coupling factor transport system ATP-binding protein|nr:ATP-binding cassette domain-containing protein [Coriobacteriales bacterium]
MDAVTVTGLSFAYPGGNAVTTTEQGEKPGVKSGGTPQVKPQEESGGTPRAESALALTDISFGVTAGQRVLLCGMTGSGKSTLLRCLKPELRPSGAFSGSVALEGESVDELDPQQSASAIGFVLQDPHQQIVMDNVRAELAFGLENLSVAPEAIHRRIAEIANFFGINTWLDKSTDALSAGQKQVVNLAAVIAMQPKLLLLDEPTAQLDPIASKDFTALLQRVNEELGITVIIIEHQIEEVLSASDLVLFLQEGRLALCGSPQEFISYLARTTSPFVTALPYATRLALENTQHSNHTEDDVWPLDVKEGRQWLRRHSAASGLDEPPSQKTVGPAQTTRLTDLREPVLSAQRIWYRYDRDEPYVLRELSLDVAAGQILGIVGGNGSGKSTLLNLLAGVSTPQHGRIRSAAGLKRAALPQDSTTLFLRDTLLDDVMSFAPRFGFTRAEALALLERLELSCYVDTHPFDLSGGEQQKAALAKLVLTGANLLLLDEPTKGIDTFAQRDLAAILDEQRQSGCAIVLVSHDLEFVSRCAERCVMLFDGTLIGADSTANFFASTMFYTTAAQRLTRGITT